MKPSRVPPTAPRASALDGMMMGVSGTGPPKAVGVAAGAATDGIGAAAAAAGGTYGAGA